MSTEVKTQKPALDLVDEQVVCQYTSTSRSFWRKHRVNGTGPRYYKLGVAVRYSLNDVVAWLEAQRVAA